MADIRQLLIIFSGAVFYIASSSPLLAAEPEWKTYRNDKGHFEISYPGDWKVYEDRDLLKIGVPHDPYFVNTNARAGIEVGVTHDVDACNEVSGGIIPKTNPAEGIDINEIVTINSMRFQFSRRDPNNPEGSAGMRDSGSTYQTAHNHICYQITLDISDSVRSEDHRRLCVNPKEFSKINNQDDDYYICSSSMSVPDDSPLQLILYKMASTLKFTD